LKRFNAKKSQMINWSGLSDQAAVKTICLGLRQMRLNRNVSQDELSKRSGLNRATIVRMEAGRAATLLTVVQVLRALNNLDAFNGILEEPQLSPLNILQQQEKIRRRASSPHRKKV
jgi:predicted transcriptional regulator